MHACMRNASLLLNGCDRMSCTVAFAAISTKLSLSRKTVKIVVAFPTQSYTGEYGLHGVIRSLL